MNWDCAQLEERLSEYLEGQLSNAERAAADAHARTCPRCAEWAEARRATRWLRQWERLESPPGLETRILAQTLAPPAQEGFWATLERGGRALLQPRFALGLAAAVFSLTLMVNALDVPVTDIRLADLNPANLYRALDRQAHLSYARGVRFVNDLRLVYEIRSRLEELAPAAEPPPAPAPPGKPTPTAPDSKKKPENSVGDGRPYWLLASHYYGGLGEAR